MIVAIIRNPHGDYPKWPQLFTAEDVDGLDRQVKRSIAGLKAYRGARVAALTTVEVVTATDDITAKYLTSGESTCSE
ncbi:hypothetical protein [Streptomyces chryseus]|uniref:hypothetical protein n=1 Tax=Streptomyces chryseus TaxID=68186 RepID=UPI00110FF00E|nr:hypothetical protein [Streptomyces chryseus]GGX26714.1 hypothetical protein GCM10010353_47260 [Streptomyces chryseus]